MIHFRAGRAGDEVEVTTGEFEMADPLLDRVLCSPEVFDGEEGEEGSPLAEGRRGPEGEE